MSIGKVGARNNAVHTVGQLVDSAMLSTSRRPSTSTVEASIFTHSEAGRTRLRIPACSLITINYNDKEGLERTVASLLQQTSRDYAVFVRRKRSLLRCGA